MFHKSLESSVTPRKRTEVTRGTMLPLTVMGLSRDHLRLRVNMMVWDLRALSLTPIDVHHLLMMVRYLWHLALIVGMSIPPIRIARSSAKACKKVWSRSGC